MPQIEESQFVNWGSMRPDIIPLAAPGITIAVGPNGSGKSCWLDGLKVILGVADFSQRRTPASYIFNGGPSGIPADQAWLRATFANPVQSGQRYRVFAVAGSGCENAEHVTVICRVQGDKRRYLVRPGRVTWGRDRPIESDLDDLVARTPDNQWLGPQKYDHLLERAGVSKALRGVLSLPQGETDRLVTETRSGLMRRLLELTGRQATLDEFRVARAKYGEAMTLHREARQHFEQKKLGLAHLQSKLRQHREWEALREQLRSIDDFLLPAARHYAAAEDLDEATKSFSRKQDEVASLKTSAEVDRKTAEAREAEIPDLKREHEELGEQEKRLGTAAADAAVQLGTAGEQARHAWREFDEAWAVAGRASPEKIMAAVESAETSLSGCLHSRDLAKAEIAALQDAMERLLTGGSVAPAVVRAFYAQLRQRGIEAIVVGDALAGAAGDATGAAHAQAALGDALWAIIVPPASYQQARELASATDYPWPVAPAGPGSPSGALRLSGSGELGALLAALDAVPASDSSEAAGLIEAGADATTPDGMRHGRFLSRMTPVREYVLHPAAREAEAARIRKAMEDYGSTVRKAGAEADSLREQLASAYRLLDAVRRLQEKRQVFRVACQLLVTARAAHRSAMEEHARASASVKELFGQLQTAIAEAVSLGNKAAASERLLLDAENQLSGLARKRLVAELAAEATPLPPGFTDADFSRLETASTLEVRSAVLTAEVNDRGRFPDDVRDPVIVSQCEAEEGRLADVEQLVADRSGEMKAREGMVEESRRRYDEHIRALVRRLRHSFSDICTTAGIDGSIELAPGDMQEELGIDVLVSHKIGETPVSYREGSHSGGQSTKIAIMLLLAAMGLGHAADLLIVDEHNAHLDGTNSGQIAQLMRQLSSRVQFILSAPTDGKGTAVAGSCDIQVTFLPRDPGHTLSPPVRLMSRLDAPSLDARFESLQQPLI